MTERGDETIAVDTIGEKDSDEGYTEIVVILDQSGSMNMVRGTAINSFNEFLESQKNQGGGRADLTLVLFNHAYHLQYQGVPITDVSPLTPDTYHPMGNTALLDAIGKSVSDSRSRIAEIQEGERPDRAIVCVITDGIENASREYSLSQIHSLITEMDGKDGWDFMALTMGPRAFSHICKMGFAGDKVKKCATGERGVRESCGFMNRAVEMKRKKNRISDWDQDTPGVSDPVQRSPINNRPWSSQSPESLSKRRFWGDIIRRSVQKQYRRHAGCFPQPLNQLVAGGDLPGTAYIYTALPNSTTVMFRVSQNEAQPDLFQEIREFKSEIESAFGGELSWSERGRQNEISLLLPGGGLHDRLHWNSIQEQMIDTMIALEHAISSVLNKINTPKQEE
jgi:uncharacterized protein YegL